MSASLRSIFLAVLGIGLSPSALASYGQMKLTGIVFLLATSLLYLWCGLLVLPLALKWAERKAVAIALTVITGLQVCLVVAVLGDGSAMMNRRPLDGWGMFVVLLIFAAAPVMLLAPLLQLASHARAAWSRLPLALVVGALVFVPAGSAATSLLQAAMVDRTHSRALALTHGRILPHVVESRERAARSWLSPYLWNEEAELQWIVIGVSRLDFIDSPAPISADDTKALSLLVSLSQGTDIANYTWKLEGKLIWDRLVRSAAAEKFSVASSLTKPQAREFAKFIGEAHADWLCTPLAEPETRSAIEHVWRLLSENDGRQFAKEVRERCGTAIDTPPKRTDIRFPAGFPAAARQGQVTAVPPRPDATTGR